MKVLYRIVYSVQDLILTPKTRQLLSAGHVFDVGRNLKLKPSVLLKWIEGGSFQYDLTANLLIHEILRLGISYRMKDSFDLLIQWNIIHQLSLGYSYGYPTSRLAPRNLAPIKW